MAQGDSSVRGYGVSVGNNVEAQSRCGMKLGRDLKEGRNIQS